jgi:hypothetical protein
LVAGISRYRLDSIVFKQGGGSMSGLSAALRRAGMRRAPHEPSGYDVWLRRPQRKPKSKAAH